MNTILTDDDIFQAGKDCFWPLDEDAPKFARAIEAAVLAKLREQEPVVEFRGRRLTPEGTRECWGVLLCDFMQDPTKGTKLYAAPLPAVVQVPQLVAKELERIAQDPPISGNEIAQARVLMAARSIRDFGLSGGAAAPEAPATAVVPQIHSVLRIGSQGSAFDMPSTRRAFTYRDQPGNTHASQLGRAAAAAAQARGGDSIDAGLALLKCLQDEGYGVFQLAAAPAAPALPAEVREALKVAREALGKVDTACRLIPEDLEGYLEPLSDALSDARAAIAQLDALGGVE